MEALHKSFERQLAGEDTVFIPRSISDLNTPEICIQGENPCDHLFTKLVGKRLRIDSKPREYRRGDEEEIEAIPFLFRKSVYLGYG